MGSSDPGRAIATKPFFNLSNKGGKVYKSTLDARLFLSYTHRRLKKGPANKLRILYAKPRLI